MLYPFGYGLGYSHFALSEPEFSGGELRVTVKNTGGVFAENVVQAYVRGYSQYDVPNGSLCGFERVALAPGESRRVAFAIAPEAFDTVLPDGSRQRSGTRFTFDIRDGAGAECSIIIEL